MDSTDLHPSRRQVVGSAGGLAAAATSAQAQAAPQPTEPLRDPTTKYPRPPFNKQQQDWPGLAGKMDPVPDHGETSYRGAAVSVSPAARR